MTRIDPAELARLVEKIAELLPQAPLNVGGPDGLSIDNDGDPPFEDGHFVKWLSRDEDSAVIAVIVPIDARDAGLALSDLIALAPTMAAAITALVAERGPLVCTGCGSVQTVEQIRAEHPRALSCCPERQMVPQAEARLREIERAWEMFDGLAVQDVGEQQKSYEALRAAITLAKP